MLKSLTIQLMTLEVLGSRVNFVATDMLANKSPWCSFATCALVGGPWAIAAERLSRRHPHVLICCDSSWRMEVQNADDVTDCD
jgi:hypothetical protein